MLSKNQQKPIAHQQAQGNPSTGSGANPEGVRLSSAEVQRRGIEGMVLEALPAANFKIKLHSGEEVIGYLAGKMRMYYIKVLPGDRVLVELSPDGKRGRIVRRL